MTPEVRKKIRTIQLELRELLREGTETIDLEIEDRLAVFLFEECARQDQTPNELIEEIVTSYLDKETEDA